jgi:hypothetical protein
MVEGKRTYEDVSLGKSGVSKGWKRTSCDSLTSDGTGDNLPNKISSIIYIYIF